jgi:hypothetical protein
MLVDGSARRADLVGLTGWIATERLGSRSFLVAGPAFEGRAETLLSALRREDPGALLPWGPMAHMLTVTAGEQSHPLPCLVLVEGDDGALPRVPRIHDQYRTTMLSCHDASE